MSTPRTVQIWYYHNSNFNPLTSCSYSLPSSLVRLHSLFNDTIRLLPKIWPLARPLLGYGLNHHEYRLHGRAELFCGGTFILKGLLPLRFA